MRTREIAVAAATLLLAVPVIGCGGDKKTNRAKATSQAGAAEAKSAARTAVTGVESCFADSQDYSQCKSPSVLSAAGLKAGTGPGQARVVAATAATYKIEAHAPAGAVFVVQKDANGTTSRTCSGEGCVGGKW